MDTYTINQGRWTITSTPEGPDTERIDGDLYRLTVDRESVVMTLTEDEADPYDVSRTYLRKTAIDRLIEGSERQADGCALWLGAKDGHGYGVLRVHSRDGRQVFTSAHKLAWTLAGGVTPKGLRINHVCHSNSSCPGGKECQHRRCVRPEHMEISTPAHNNSRTNSRRWPV